MKNIKRNQACYYIINFLIISMVILGLLKANPITAEPNSAKKEEEINNLEIMQGEFIQGNLSNNETLSFTLDVKTPREKVSYYWEVVVPPKFGVAQVSPMGKKVEATYSPLERLEGVDFFIVQVRDDVGSRAQTQFTITNEPNTSSSVLSNPKDVFKHEPGSATPMGSGYETPLYMEHSSQQLYRSNPRIQPESPQLLDAPDNEPYKINERKSSADSEETKYLSDTAAEREGPYFEVSLYWNEIYTSGWATNASLNLTIDDPENGEGVDYSDSGSGSSYYFYINNFRLEPGQMVTISDGSTTKTHTIINLAVTDFDEVADTIAGTGNPGDLEVNADDGENFAWLYPVATTDGTWQADFSGSVDIASGTGGYVYQYDIDGDLTTSRWAIPDPYIQVYPMRDNVYSYDWPPNTSVTLSIGEDQWVQQTNEYGNIYFYLEQFDIIAEQEIVMTDGTYTRSHIVTNLTVTGLDEENDTVNGTAQPGSEVYVNAWDDQNWEDLIVTTDSSGNWTASFSTLDITSGSGGYAIQYDTEGNSTNIYWYVPDPHIQVYPMRDNIYGYNWPPNTSVTLSIGEDQWVQQTNENGSIDFYLSPFDIFTGQEIMMTDGTYTRSHIVTNLTVTGFDEENDTVNGTAQPGSEVYVDAWDDQNWEDLTVTTDSSGNWTASFSYLDITSGARGYAVQYDAEGNSTNIYWYVPDPYMRVYPLDDRVTGNDWTINSMITLSIGETQWTNESDEGGWVSFNIEPFDILPGHEIVMTDGFYTRIHIVRDLAITSVDEENNIVTGTAAPESLVTVTANDDYDWESKEVIADTTGLWTVDFSGMINFASGTSGYAMQYDDEDNSTNVRWFIPDPRFQVYIIGDYIYGSQWTPNSTVTASIDGIVKGSGIFDENGWGYIDIDDEFATGQVVSLTDGIYTRSHTVLDLAVTNIDPTLDIVTGRAEPGSELKYVSTFYEDDWYFLYPITDSSGVWRADFSGIADLMGGATGWAVQADENKNETVVRWFVPDPSIVVYPSYGEIYGSQWSTETTITLTIGSDQWTQVSNQYNGSVYFYPDIDLTPGLTVQMTDGVTTRMHTIIDLAVTDFDTATDTITGTADPGELTVYTCDNSDCYFRYPVADSSGNWTADFSGDVDIVAGMSGYIYQYDDDGDMTRMSWFLPDPWVEVRPNSDKIYGYDWMPDTEITLKIGGSSWEKASSYWGYVYFDLESFDIQPGQVVEMTDGTYKKTHQVTNLSVTAYDETTETLSGTAEPGELTVDAYRNGSETLYPTADSGGNWNVEFTSFDIAPGAHASIYQYDDDEDRTFIHWLIPDPIIRTYPEDDYIFGQDWPQNSEITLSIEDNRETWAETSSEYGYVYFDLEPFNLEPGQLVTMSAGTYTQTHTVKNTLVTVIDQYEDIISGIAEVDAELHVCAYNFLGMYYVIECLSVTADSTGEWVADFSGLLDLSPGIFGYVDNYDQFGNSTTISWDISDGSPFINGQKELNTPEDTNLQITLVDLYVTDPDSTYPDDFSLTIMSGTNYTLTGNTITPPKDFYGTLTVPVKVNDGLYNSNTFELSISVTPVNDPPIVENIPSQNINEGEAFSTIALNTYVSDVDNTNDDITWTTTGEIDLQVTIDSENVATIVIPDVNWSGSEVITFSATDPEGDSDSDSATFSVNAVGNTPPVITEDDPQAVTMSEDGNPTPFNLTLNASDDDGDTITWGISSQATNGTANASGSGTSMTIGYTPNKDYNGSDSFVVQVLDGNGGTDTITINVTIEAVNDAPIIISQATTLSTQQEVPLLISLTDLNVDDVDNTYPDDFTLTVLNGPNYIVDGNTITPIAEFSGILEVSVKVNDGELDSNEFKLSVTVSESNEIFLPLILR